MNDVDREREKDSILLPFAVLNFASLFEMVELPADEGVVERIGISGDERATPINLRGSPAKRIKFH